jgi:hypothetical protein
MAHAAISAKKCGIESADQDVKNCRDDLEEK